MTEKQFTQAVISLGNQHGWKAAHFGNSVKLVRRKTGYAAIPDRHATGFPDLCMVKDERLLFAELKSRRGVLTDAQQEWLTVLQKTGAEVYIWREHRDWPGNVAKVLTSEVRLQPVP